MSTKKITVQTRIQAPVEKVWKAWTSPADITQWNQASEDWHSPHAENDLRKGGSFKTRMEAKDGSAGFDFGGVYDEVTEHKRIVYTMEDGRKVEVEFSAEGEETFLVERFDAENTYSEEMQRSGWQAILENFRRHVEGS